MLVIAVSCRETFWLITHGLTIVPSSDASYWRKAEAVASVPLGRGLSSSNPIRQAPTTYLHLAGIETGYGYFAPNIPGGYKLVFELHYPDGHVEPEVPRVNSSAGALRMASLLDQIGRTDYEPLRRLMIRMLAHSVWRAHPNAIMIRAVFGAATLPAMGEFEKGKRASYEFLYAYDFTLSDKTAKPGEH